jgi:L-threonylcarbamoyladenylate synthase
MKIDSKNPDTNRVERIGKVIREGGIIIYPTDTVYGLGCDPFNKKALEGIFSLKGRGHEKGVLVLIPSFGWLTRLTIDVKTEMLDLCRTWWPGPITCLFRAAPGLPGLLFGSGGKIGVRMPDSRFLLDCMNSIPGPLVSTSANLSGESAVTRFSDISPELIEGVDLFLEDESSYLSDRSASTVVDLTGERPLVVREGEGIEKILAAGIRP